jgi:hypothetical protein
MRRIGRPRIEIPTNSVWGRWTVLGPGRPPKNHQGDSYYKVRCECGVTKTVSSYRLRHGDTTQCPKCSFLRHPFEDITNKVFGKWTVVKRLSQDERPKDKNASWLCRCECGREVPRSRTQIDRGDGCRQCGGSVLRRIRPYEGLYNVLRSRVLYRYDRSKTYDFTLTYERFVSLIETGKCHYCHIPIHWEKWNATKSGFAGYHLDRKANDLGYSDSNCVACCTPCNFAKGARYSYTTWYGMTKYSRDINDKKQFPLPLHIAMTPEYPIFPGEPVDIVIC